MKGLIGCPARIVTRIPRFKSLVRDTELSDKAKSRLKVVDRYLHESPKFSGAGRSVPLTCRHFGLHRSYVCRRLKRSDPRNLHPPGKGRLLR